MSVHTLLYWWFQWLALTTALKFCLTLGHAPSPGTRLCICQVWNEPSHTYTWHIQMYEMAAALYRSYCAYITTPLHVSSAIPLYWDHWRSASNFAHSQAVTSRIKLPIPPSPKGKSSELVQCASVVTDSEFASESANFSSVRPSPSPRIFGGRKWRFWNVAWIATPAVTSAINSRHVDPPQLRLASSGRAVTRQAFYWAQAL